MAIRKTRKASKPKAKGKITAEQLATRLRPVVLGEEASSSPLELLASLEVSNPLILVGPESLRIRRLISWLKEKLFAGQSGVTHFGTELNSASSVQEILRSLTNFSLFSNCEFVTIFEADKVRAASSKQLVEVVASGRLASFVVFAADSMGAQSSLLNQLAPYALVVEVKELSGNKLARWIEKEARRYQASIERAAASLLADSYGNDLLALSGELSKLSLLTADDELITRDLVSSVSSRAPDRTSFELLTQMGRRDVEASLALLKNLLDQGLHPLQLNSFLSRSLRTMLAASDSGISKEELSPELGNQWFLRNLRPSLSAFTSEDLRKSFESIVLLDKKLKSSGIEDHEHLRSTVQRIASRSY